MNYNKSNRYTLLLITPFFALFLTAYFLNLNNVSFVGLLSSVPALAAIFSSVRVVASTSILCLSLALLALFNATDENLFNEKVRLFAIFVVSIFSLVGAIVRANIDKRNRVIFEQLALANAVTQFAELDYLTGILNRHGLVNRATNFESQARTLVFFDLDKFKEVNDVYGHNVGDQFLQSVASRISAALKHEDILGRWGGDEFVAIIGASDEDTLRIIDRVLLSVCKDPVTIGENSLPVNLSAGVADWDRNLTFEQALENADKGLYEAKRRGGRQVVGITALANHGPNGPHAH